MSPLSPISRTSHSFTYLFKLISLFLGFTDEKLIKCCHLLAKGYITKELQPGQC